MRRSSRHARSTRVGYTSGVRRHLVVHMDGVLMVAGVEVGKHFNPPGAVISWGGASVMVSKYEVGLPFKLEHWLWC